MLLGVLLSLSLLLLPVDAVLAKLICRLTWKQSFLLSAGIAVVSSLLILAFTSHMALFSVPLYAATIWSHLLGIFVVLTIIKEQRSSLRPLLLSLCLATLALIPLSAVSKTKLYFRKEACASNLRQIQIACEIYKQDYGGKYPLQLVNLYPKYLADRRLLLCPCKHFRSGAVPSVPLDDSMVDYIYVPGPLNPVSQEIILCRDKQGNHPDGSVSILYLNRKIEWLSKDGKQSSPDPVD